MTDFEDETVARLGADGWLVRAGSLVPNLSCVVRELVENALDACESIRELPDIEITLQEFDTEGLNALIGVVAHERLDSSLYESAKAATGKKARVAATRNPCRRSASPHRANKGV